MPNLPISVMQPTLHSKSYSMAIQTIEDKYSAYDLTTPDGKITNLTRIDENTMKINIIITNIDSEFKGFKKPKHTSFNVKSTLSQLGIHSLEEEIILNEDKRSANISCLLRSLMQFDVLQYITEGSYIGKLFCGDPSRAARTKEYIMPLLERVDLKGCPLLVYGRNVILPGSNGKGEEIAEQIPEWHLEEKDGRVVAFLPILSGKFHLDNGVCGLLPTIGKALKDSTDIKPILRLHQNFINSEYIIMNDNESIITVRSYPMHMKTMFGRVVADMLPKGLKCISDIIEPMSVTLNLSEGRTFTLYGKSNEPLKYIPVEFFALEAYREHVSFEQRKTLAQRCEEPLDVLKVFKTMTPGVLNCATYICKGSMFDTITEKDWVVCNPEKERYVGNEDPYLQRVLAEKYLYQQASYGILSAISVGEISSDGVLFCRYFPSPVLKSLLLTRQCIKRVRAIYFTRCSRHHGSFFSHDDSSMLKDLITFGISVFYVDEAASAMYQFMLKSGRTAGVFVPLAHRHEYLNSTSFGVYGSNLVSGDFEVELKVLLENILLYRSTCTHPLLNADKHLTLVTGGGPGAMEVGNRVAMSLGILSCGMFVDFNSLSHKPGTTINEQHKNNYVQAFMSYRPEKLIERQSDFNVDLPIFLAGGIGTDFEYALEEVRRKVGSVNITPLILFGTEEHWGNKIGSRFSENYKSGTIKGSEWISNVPWVVETGMEAYLVLKYFFEGVLPIGPGFPINERGYMVASKHLPQ